MDPFLGSNSDTGAQNVLLHGAYLSYLQSCCFLRFGLGLHTPHGSTNLKYSYREAPRTHVTVYVRR